MNFIVAVIFGIIAGLLTCLFIKNPSTFCEAYIIFGSVYFLIVFGYIALKIQHISFIKKNPMRFLFELLFIALFTYLYCILVYHLRGLSIKKDNLYFILLSVLFIIIHTLIELAGMYDR
jgi:hypothetical protein